MSSISLSRSSLLAYAEEARNSLGRRLALSVAASLFVAICAHISLPMPFTPVPTTMQTFAVVLVGMLLGPVGGFTALSFYLAEGALGMPVFSPQGPGGIAQLLGPTAGYLLAYPFAAALAGAAVQGARRVMSAFPAALLAGALALFPVFAMGALWLATLLHRDAAVAMHLGVTPFLLGELVKLCAAAAAYTALQTPRRA